MPSIVNGLFAGRAGIASQGAAIAVVGDDIANSSTIGFKASRAEFEDLIAGGQAAGQVVGSGSQLSSVAANYSQGTLEHTGNPLDLAIDGNGFFVVASGESRFYTRAGNFKTSAAGYIVNQNDQAVLGFPSSSGSGELQPLNVNSISQSSISTSKVTISANLNASATVSVPPAAPSLAGATGSTTTYADLSAAADFQTDVNIFDNLGGKHTVTFFFSKTASNTWQGQGYVKSDDVDPSGSAAGLPRRIATASTTLSFNSDGTRSNSPATGSFDITANIPWNNGSGTNTVKINFNPITQYSAPSNALSISQDGQGVGTVTSLDIRKSGQVYALLSNGQNALVGTLALANFASPQGLVRVGNSLLQQSGESGEPVIGKAQTGTVGAIQAGSVELSTVDIADEFVKLITLQRGFQASSRIITTINQLLNDIVQLA